MDLIIKAFLAKQDGSTEVRRLPLSLGKAGDVVGLYGKVRIQLATIFPDLTENSFIISWKDSDGDYVLVSSDEELLEAIGEMDSRQLKVYLTESPADEQTDCTAAMFPGQTRKRRPCGPWMRVSEEEKGERSVKDDKGWKTALRDLVPSKHRRWAKGYIRQWRQRHLQNATDTGSSDDDKAQKITQDEAGVPTEYVTYLETETYRLHKAWARERAGKPDKEYLEAKATVPSPFQNWCRWYLKKHFGPERTPHFKRPKADKAVTQVRQTQSVAGDDGKGQQEVQGQVEETRTWKKEWRKMQKGIRKAVPSKQRDWTKSFITNWRLEKLPEKERARYVIEDPDSDSSDSGEKGGKPNPADVPEDYISWVDLFLTQWHRNQGDHPSGKDARDVATDIKQITDAQVPPSYRKWVRFYIIRVLGKKTKDRKQEAEVNTWRQYRGWMFSFQKQWISRQDEDPDLPIDSSDSSSDDDSDDDDEAADRKARRKDRSKRREKAQEKPESIQRPKTAIERLKAIIESDAEYDNEMPVPPQTKPPAEFRHWALGVFAEWDGVTIGQGMDDDDVKSRGVEDEDLEVPPSVFNWMMKAMARIQIKRLQLELRDARKADKKRRREERKERKQRERKERKERKGKKDDSDDEDKKKERAKGEQKKD